MDAAAIDQIRLNFDPQTLSLLNGVIGLMMFGMALDLSIEDFRRVGRSPKGPAVGLAAQFLVLPFLTFLLTLVLPIHPSMALGMILVAACPGGNLSNLMTYLAGGNAALSIGMTAISTSAAVFMTPINLTLWGRLNPATAQITRQVQLSPLDVLQTIVVILGIPLAAGLLVGHLFPGFVKKTRKPFKLLSVLIFLGILGLALAANWDIFLEVIGVVAFVVFLHNATALGTGYGIARGVGLDVRDARAVAIEVGIQNSALGLLLIFNFFDGLGGMAIVAAWWGIWHIIAGLSIAAFWSRGSLLARAPGTMLAGTP